LLLRILSRAGKPHRRIPDPIRAKATPHAVIGFRAIVE